MRWSLKQVMVTVEIEGEMEVILPIDPHAFYADGGAPGAPDISLPLHDVVGVQLVLWEEAVVLWLRGEGGE